MDRHSLPSRERPHRPPHEGLREGHGLAWAKAVLLGEHSVVYGHPAVAVPLRDLRMRATARPVPGPSRLSSLGYSGPVSRSGPRFACVARALEVARELSGCPGQSFEIETDSDFPHERGLGSSAAAAGAVIRAVLDACRRPASDAELFTLTQAAERVAHGRPSGLDAVATYALSPIRFQDGEVRRLAQRIENAYLVVADSGVTGRTREAVGSLRQRYERDTAATGALIDGLGELTRAAVTALRDGDAQALGAAMDRAHTALARLGVSLPVLDRLTQDARRAGARGAKLTGGGLGGCVIALVEGAEPAGRVRSALRRSGAVGTWIHRMRVSEPGQAAPAEPTAPEQDGRADRDTQAPQGDVAGAVRGESR